MSDSASLDDDTARAIERIGNACLYFISPTQEDLSLVCKQARLAKRYREALRYIAGMEKAKSWLDGVLAMQAKAREALKE